MPEDRVDRRLAAIFAGDIAGYHFSSRTKRPNFMGDRP
jgi:hypothetical protein